MPGLPHPVSNRNLPYLILIKCRLLYSAFPITTYQPVYFLAESLEDAKQRMRQFCENLPRPFFALHNAQTESVHIDRPVLRTKGAPEGH